MSYTPLFLSLKHTHTHKKKKKKDLLVSAVVVPCADSSIFILYVIKAVFGNM